MKIVLKVKVGSRRVQTVEFTGQDSGNFTSQANLDYLRKVWELEQSMKDLFPGATIEFLVREK